MHSAYPLIAHAQIGQPEGEGLAFIVSIPAQVFQMDPRLAHQELICKFAIHDFTPKKQKQRALTGDLFGVEGSDQGGRLLRRPCKLVHFLLQHFNRRKLFF